jgi:co-chaperonin GroES (HSP10)
MTKKTKVLEVLGPRIKVKVSAPVEQKSAGGIIMTTDIKNQEDQESGVVVQLGHCAYGNFTKNWCEVGDEVLFQRYAGKPREELAEDGTIGYYRILKDIDVIGVIREKDLIEAKVNDR